MLGIDNGKIEDDCPSQFFSQKIDDKAFFDISLYTTRAAKAKIRNSSRNSSQVIAKE